MAKSIARALRGTTVPTVRAETEDDRKEAAKTERVSVPVLLLQAAETVVSKVPKDKPTWQAVFLHQKDGMGRVVAIDDKYSIFIGAFEAKPMPAWLKTGISVAREDLKARVNMIHKIAESQNVILSYAKGQTHLTMSDEQNTMAFQVPAAEVQSMPDYEASLQSIDAASVADMGEEGERSARAEWEPVAIGSRYMQECIAIAKILLSSQDKAARDEHGVAIRMFHPTPSAPRIFDFDGWPGVMLIVGAMQMEVQQLPRLTQRLMEPASRGTLAALRAHETRWRDAAAAAETDEQRAACTAKADGFAQRIAALVAVAVSKPALPPPAPMVALPSKDGEDTASASGGAGVAASGTLSDEAAKAIADAMAQEMARVQTSAEKAAASRKERAARRAKALR